MDFYVQILEDPASFSHCTNGLAGEGHAYNFPDAPIDGFGALKSLKLSDFECDITPDEPGEEGFGCFLQEKPAPDQPTGGSGGTTTISCMENPNWFEGNAPTPLFGSSTVDSGQVILSAGNNPAFVGATLAYRRVVCADDIPCLFVLTDLKFHLSDVKFGPVTLKAPHVVLDHEAAGSQLGNDIKIAAGQLVLRVESKVFVGGKPILGGAVIPLWISNDKTAHLKMKNGSISITDANFDLTFAGKASLKTEPSQCVEW